MSYCVVLPVSGPIVTAFDDDANDYPIHVTLQYFPDDPSPEDISKIAQVCAETSGFPLHVTVAPQLRSFGSPDDPLRCLVALIPFPDSALLTQVKDDFRARLARASVHPPDERFPTYVPHVTLGEYPIADTLRKTLTPLPESQRSATLAVPLLQDEGVAILAASEPLNGPRLARVAGWTVTLFNEDQLRDDHGRFGSGGGDTSASPSHEVTIGKLTATLAKQLNEELTRQGVAPDSPIRHVLGAEGSWRGMQVAVSRDVAGKITGAAAYEKSGKNEVALHDFRALTKGEGAGTAVLAEVARTIADQPNPSMSVYGAVPGATSYYQHVGAEFQPKLDSAVGEPSYHWGSTGTWDAEAVRALAAGNPIDRSETQVLPGPGEIWDGSKIVPVTAAGFTEDDHPRDEHGKFTSGEGGEDSSPDPNKSGAPARNADEVKSWPTVPGPLGSQGGTWHKDPSTDKVYLLKPTKDLDHAQNEVAAGKVYQAAGVPFPNTFVLSDDQQNAYTLSEKVPDLKQLTEAQWKADPELQAKAAANFGTDALLSHWDVLGLEADNTLVTQDGTPVRIESGGAMSYRAMGGPKDSFAPGKPWVEPDSMRTSAQGKVMYGGMTDKQAAQSLMKAALINLDDVRQAWRDAGIPNHVSQGWYDTLRARQDQIPDLVTHMLANPFATLPARRIILALVADACHMPAGSPDGGQFVPCDTPGAVDAQGNTPDVQVKAADQAAALAKANPGAGPLASLKNTGPTKSQSVAYALWKLKNSPEGEKAAAQAKHVGNQTVYPYPGGKFKELVVTPNPDGKGHTYELVPQGQLSQTLNPTQAVQEAQTTTQMSAALALGSDEVFSAAAQAAAAVATPSPSVLGASDKTLLLASDKSALLKEIIAQSKAGTLTQDAAQGYSFLAFDGTVPQGEMAAVLTGEASFSSGTWEAVDAALHEGDISAQMGAAMLAAQAGGIQNPDSLAGQIDTKGIFGVSQEITDLGGMNAPPYEQGAQPGPQAGAATDSSFGSPDGPTGLPSPDQAAAYDKVSSFLSYEKGFQAGKYGAVMPVTAWHELYSMVANGNLLPEAQAILQHQTGEVLSDQDAVLEKLADLITSGALANFVDDNEATGFTNTDPDTVQNTIQTQVEDGVISINEADAYNSLLQTAIDNPGDTPMSAGAIAAALDGKVVFNDEQWAFVASQVEDGMLNTDQAEALVAHQFYGGQPNAPSDYLDEINENVATDGLEQAAHDLMMSTDHAPEWNGPNDTSAGPLEVQGQPYTPGPAGSIVKGAYDAVGKLPETNKTFWDSAAAGMPLSTGQWNTLLNAVQAGTISAPTAGYIITHQTGEGLSVDDKDAITGKLAELAGTPTPLEVQSPVTATGQPSIEAKVLASNAPALTNALYDKLGYGLATGGYMNLLAPNIGIPPAAIAAAVLGESRFNGNQMWAMNNAFDKGALSWQEANAVLVHQFGVTDPAALKTIESELHNASLAATTTLGFANALAAAEAATTLGLPKFADPTSQTPSVLPEANKWTKDAYNTVSSQIPNLTEQEQFQLAGAQFGGKLDAGVYAKMLGAYLVGKVDYDMVAPILIHQGVPAAEDTHQSVQDKLQDLAGGKPTFASTLSPATPDQADAYKLAQVAAQGQGKTSAAILADVGPGKPLSVGQWKQLAVLVDQGFLHKDLAQAIIEHQTGHPFSSNGGSSQAAIIGELNKFATNPPGSAATLQPGVTQAQTALGNFTPQQLAASDLSSKLGEHQGDPYTHFVNALEASGANVNTGVAADALVQMQSLLPGQGVDLATGKSLDDKVFTEVMDKAILTGQLDSAQTVALTALQFGKTEDEVWKAAGLDPGESGHLDMIDMQNLLQSTAATSFTSNATGGQVYGDQAKGLLGAGYDPKLGAVTGKWPTYATKPSSEARQLIAQAKLGKAAREWHGVEAGLPVSKFQFGNTVLTLHPAGAEIDKLQTLNRDGTLEAYQSPPPLSLPTVNVAGTPMSDSSALLSYQIPKAPEPVAPVVPPTGQVASTQGAGEIPKNPRDVNGKPLSAGSREYKRFDLLKKDLGYAKYVKHVDGPLQPKDVQLMTSAKYGTSAIPQGNVVGYSRYAMHDGILTVMKMDTGQFRLAYTYGEKTYQSSGGWKALQPAPGLKGTAAPQAEVMPHVPKGGIFVGDLDTSKAPNLIHGVGGSTSKVDEWGNKHFGSNGGKARYTASEWNSLYKYGDGHYGSINGKLRSGGMLPQDVANIDSALMRQRVPEGGVVTIRAGLGSYEQPLKDLPVGGLFRDKGFMSTSIGDKWSGNVRAVVEVPAGTPAAWSPGMAHPNEQELVLPRNTTLVKTGEAYLQGGIWYVPTKVVAIGAEPVDVQAALNAAAGTTISTGIVGTAGARMLRMLIEEAA